MYIRFVLSTLLPAYIDSRGIEPTFGLLKELGGWPVLGNNKGGNWSESQYDLTTLLLDLLRYNNKPLINLYVYTDSKNSTIRIIYVRWWYNLIFFLIKKNKTTTGGISSATTCRIINLTWHIFKLTCQKVINTTRNLIFCYQKQILPLSFTCHQNICQVDWNIQQSKLYALPFCVCALNLSGWIVKV